MKQRKRRHCWHWFMTTGTVAEAFGPWIESRVHRVRQWRNARKGMRV